MSENMTMEDVDDAINRFIDAIEAVDTKIRLLQSRQDDDRQRQMEELLDMGFTFGSKWVVHLSDRSYSAEVVGYAISRDIGVKMKKDDDGKIVNGWHCNLKKCVANGTIKRAEQGGQR